MAIAPVSRDAAAALFTHRPFRNTNTVVTVKENIATLTVHGKDLAELTFNPHPGHRIKNNGFFTRVNLNRINAVLQRAGHELLYLKKYNWLFESSQTPFGDGTTWKKVKL